MTFAQRTLKLASSPTLALTAKANRLKKEGKPVINFAAGEPDFDTPEIIKEAAQKAIRDGFTKYTPSSGIEELKEAICLKMWSENNVYYDPKNVLVTCGAKQAIYNTMLALLNPGDEVLVPVPYWVSFVEIIKLCEGVPVFVETRAEEHFVMNPDALKEKITEKTKLLVLNSPCNPTGAVYPKPVLEKISELALRHHFYVLSDEIYEKIIYDGESHTSIAALHQEIKEQTILINGVSKTYAMTGWRVGYALADEALISVMSKIQDHTTSNATSISQKAALAAISNKESHEEAKKMVQEFSARRDVIYKKLCETKGVSCFKSAGTFYIFPDISVFFNKQFNGKKILSAQDFCNALLDDTLLAIVPGEAFGDGHYVRLSFAASMSAIEEGMLRFQDAVKKFC